MPSSGSKLQGKFMNGEDDGIAKAEKILTDSGWRVDNGMLYPPAVNKESEEAHTLGEQIDARDYLLEEWDYGMGKSVDAVNAEVKKRKAEIMILLGRLILGGVIGLVGWIWLLTLSWRLAACVFLIVWSEGIFYSQKGKKP